MHIKESLTKQKHRIKQILDILSEEYPVAKIQLEFTTPYELLFSTILSAQCTDDRVNKVTEKIFVKYNKPEDFAEMPSEKLEKLIFSTGYYKAKAAHIKAASQMLLDDYNGIVPNTMEDLLKLPGVGRKTANVLLGHCFDTPGIVVDTHVLRISNRLGFTDTTNAEKIEFKLMEIIPKDQWVIFTHYFILHGRKICQSRKPKCAECLIKDLCPSDESKKVV